MKTNKSIIIWLSTICLLVFAMVVIGGITRLTHSGLSMVNWRPLMGTIPPLSEIEWLKTFELYKTSPEYKIVNLGMTLDGFKGIFLWEFGHRLLGRLVGVVFFFPWLYFIIRKRFSLKENIKLFVAFSLGGMQGLMGWYMVKSGLVENPAVSHYRLAAHLSLAFMIIGFMLWYIFDFGRIRYEKKEISKRLKLFSIFTFVILCLQIVYGAFTAGLKAGFGFNTYPKMGDAWLPPGIFESHSLLHFLLEDRGGVQFTHRVLGAVAFLIIIVLWARIRTKFQGSDLMKAANALLIMVLIQFLLGVFTLILIIPISLAVIHQLGAGVLFALFIYFLHQLFTEPDQKILP